MRKLLVLLIITTFSFNSCFSPKTIEVGKIEGVKVKQFKRNVLSVEVALPIKNPNFFSFKVVDIDLDVFVRNKAVGKITSVDDIVIPAKSNEAHNFNIDLEMTNMLLGTVAFINSLSGNNLKIKIEGFVEVKSFLFKRKIYLDKSQLITTK